MKCQTPDRNFIRGPFQIKSPKMNQKKFVESASLSIQFLTFSALSLLILLILVRLMLESCLVSFLINSKYSLPLTPIANQGEMSTKFSYWVSSIDSYSPAEQTPLIKYSPIFGSNFSSAALQTSGSKANMSN